MPDDTNEAAAALAGMLERARPVPLTGQVRVDKAGAEELIEELGRSALPAGSRQALDDLRALLSEGRPVPLTDQVRVPRARAEELAARLRAI